jgi:uncharacterized metal-binding protein
MPSGRRHDSITLWTLPWVVGLTFERTRNGVLTLAVAGGFLFSGLMFGPDLDIYSRQYQRWGPLRWMWLPYRRHMRHRSFWSHGPLVGTVGRVLYLVAWLGIGGIVAALVCAIAAYGLGKLPDWHQAVEQIVNGGWLWLGRSLQQDAPLWIALWIGLELGAMSHSLCDWLGSAYRRLRRPRRAVRPVVSAPQTAVSQTSAPQTSVPKTSAPQASARGAAAPPVTVTVDVLPARPSAADGTPTQEPQLPAFGRWLRR